MQESPVHCVKMKQVNVDLIDFVYARETEREREREGVRQSRGIIRWSDIERKRVRRKRGSERVG